MKRLMPSSLAAFLQANLNCTKADCFVIQLANGTALYTTEGQWDITFTATTPGWGGQQTTFKAVDNGVWKRGAITSEAGTKLSAGTMDLMCSVPVGTTIPNIPLSIPNATLNHIFDAATVWVYTAYMPPGAYGDVSAGVETKFQGTITKVPGLSRSPIVFECADPLYLLNLKVPSRLVQANCPWSFCDANCLLPASAYTVAFTAVAASQSTFSGLTQPDGYFNQGVVTAVTGLNTGLSQTVRSYAAGVLTVTYPFILPVSPGDTFSVIKGCDRTPVACAATTHPDGTPETADYRTRYGGAPFVPPPSAAF